MQRRVGVTATIATLMLAVGPVLRADAPDAWRVVEGRTVITLNTKALARAGLSVSGLGRAGGRGGPATATLTLAIDPHSDLKLALDYGAIAVLGGRILHVGGMTLKAGATSQSYGALALIPDQSNGYLEWLAAIDEAEPARPRILLRDTNVAIDPISRSLLITSDRVILSAELATALGHADLAGFSIGSVELRAGLEPVIGEPAEVTPARSVIPRSSKGSVAGGTSIGPDVIVWSLPRINSLPSVNGVSSYGVGTTSCNIGDAPANWIARTPEHPVISQQMYRLKGSRFEQIGMSWVKHGFATVPGGAECSTTCQAQPGSDKLYPGCSDPYSAFLNQSQDRLGPRSEINAFTGVFPFPRVVANPDCVGCAIPDRRLHVRNEDLDPALNPAAQYFIESQYVLPDDAQAGNGENNFAYRPTIFVDPSVCLAPNVEFCAGVRSSDPTRSATPAIRAWKERDAQVVETELRVPSEGLFLLSAKAFSVAGEWQYEYAVQNINSDRAAGSFSVPLPVGVNPQAILASAGFHGLALHSGEPYTTIPCATCSNNPSKFCTSDFDCPADRSACLPNVHICSIDKSVQCTVDGDCPPLGGVCRVDKGTCELAPQTFCTTNVSCPFNFAPCAPEDSPCFDGVCNGATGFCKKPPCSSGADCFGATCDTQTGMCDTAWSAEIRNGMLVWSTTPVEIDPLANALHWGQLFNFWFRVDSPPADTTVDLGLFKLGNPKRVLAVSVGPALDIVDCQPNGVDDACDLDCSAFGCAPPCGGSQDCNNNGRPDECELDCNANGVADDCELTLCIGGGSDGLVCAVAGDCPGGSCTGSNDCDGDGLLDECEPDCDGDGIPDDCDTPSDLDMDGVEDCSDLCPLTTPAGACVCPDNGCCFFDFDPGTCFLGFTRQDCIDSGGTPECVIPPCRDGCLLGDYDLDGDIDLFDASRLQVCFSGDIAVPGFVSPAAECRLRFDTDGDGDVDLIDYREYERLRGLYSGP